MTVQSRNRRAFTLIEVLIGAVIFLVIFIAASQVFFTTRVAYQHQRDLMTAENIAQQRLERLLVLAPGHGDLAAGEHAAVAYDIDGVVAEGPGVFTLRWTVQPDVPILAMRRLTAKVSWKGGDGARHDLAFTTDRD